MFSSKCQIGLSCTGPCSGRVLQYGVEAAVKQVSAWLTSAHFNCPWVAIYMYSNMVVGNMTLL